LANLELFELQPIGASSVGEYEQMQRNLQADNPTQFCLSDIYGANILLMERK
jgi:hypothetical protein